MELRDAFIYQGYGAADSLAKATEVTLLSKKPELLQGEEAPAVDPAPKLTKAVQEKKPFDIVTVSHAVEKYVLKVKGYQMLYADSYLSRTDFRKMFDHSHYDQVKRRYDPENAFPQIYEKVCKNAKVYWEKKADSQ